MEMPPGPPPLGAPGPPLEGSQPVRQVEAEAVEAGDRTDGLLADEAANRRLVATTAAFALIAVAVMLGAFLLTQGGDEEASAPPRQIPTADDPTPSDDTTAPVDEDALADEVEHIQDFVETERGLEFQDEIDIEVLADDDYETLVQDQVREDLEDDDGDLELTFGLLTAVGAWSSDVDPAEALGEFAAIGSLGFYDPETKELVVRGGEITPMVRIILAHELTHALEDQNLDLDRPELDDQPGEASSAFAAVVEGSAGRIETAYRATLTEEELADAEAEEAGFSADIDPESIPQIFVADQQFTYAVGAEFVEAVVERGGNDRLDRTLREPPTTSEEILEPETFLEGEEIDRVEAPEADGEVVDEGITGQLLLHLLIDTRETLLDEDTDGEPLPEWGGDRYVLWRDGDEWCVRAQVAGDVEGFQQGLEAWSEATAADAEVTVDGDLLELTSCAA